MRDEDRIFYGDYAEKLEDATRQLTAWLEEIISEIESEEPLAEHLKYRVKSAASARVKLAKLKFDETPEQALTQLSDVIGLRVVVRFIGDIYLLETAMHSNERFRIIDTEDYIAAPKTSGYRSMHVAVEVPFPASPSGFIQAEIQLRTIAMDCWASLEHQLKYKKEVPKADLIAGELCRCADEMASTDLTLQTIRDLLSTKDLGRS